FHSFPTRRSSDLDGVAQVVAVTVRQQHRVDLRKAGDRNIRHGIARQERVDDHAPAVGFEREAGVAVEDDLEHAGRLYCPICFLYAPASSRWSSSAGVFTRSLIIHPAPYGSRLTSAGSFCSAAFTSVTVPESGA